MRKGRYQEPELQSTKGVTVRNGHIEIITMLLLLFFESKLRNGALNYTECDTSAILYNLQPTPHCKPLTGRMIHRCTITIHANVCAEEATLYALDSSGSLWEVVECDSINLQQTLDKFN